MKYFNECQTLEEVKALYKKLAKENHPDAGGDTATMQAINTEYAYACAVIAKGASMSDAEADEEIRLSEEYRQIIEAIINLPGIVIELVGRWLWISGNTYPVRKELSTAELTYHGKKKVWYYSPDEYKKRGTNKSLDEIKAKYGSEQITARNNSKVLKG
ncbi:J domain-containing protein [Filimonas effusa]|uniref:J domain-containing protein n=1 Tax=Filimonas effusa TaxID=2508721 RepID=A0A4Q1D0M0_9BACT|nr:J domain-containing protein [Filimonas effusa]RXK81279.1 J domain-containing protein [Filimonas effusa]